MELGIGLQLRATVVRIRSPDFGGFLTQAESVGAVLAALTLARHNLRELEAIYKGL